MIDISHKQSWRYLITIIFSCLCFFPSAVFAAPFCVEAQGIPPECWYYDAKSCREEAAKRQGRCSFNTDEVAATVPDKNISFCIVGSDMVPVCAYQSGEDCDREAEKRNAVCFENANAENQGDPYHMDQSPFPYN